jgi:hypothetical protein
LKVLQYCDPVLPQDEDAVTQTLPELYPDGNETVIVGEPCPETIVAPVGTSQVNEPAPNN